MATQQWKLSYLLGVLLMSCSVQSIPQEQMDLIDALMAYHQEDNFPGVTLGVVQDGDIVVAKGYGKSNYFEDVDVENNTLFAVGSVSKGLCGMLVVKVLSERYPELGESVLDTPISELAPELNFTLSDRYRTQVTTFRDLLAHKVGITQQGYSLLMIFEATSTDEAMYRTRYIPEVATFRSGLIYSNEMIALAGYLAGRIAGKPYHELMADFFVQLDMRSSRIIDTDGIFADLPNMSRAYTVSGGEKIEYDKNHVRRLSMAPGAAGVLTTSEDMAKYMRFFLSGGSVDGVQVVPEYVMRYMHTSSVEVKYGFDASTATGSYGYSLGYQLSLYEGQPMITHPGYFHPYASGISLFPEYSKSDSSFGVFTSLNGPGLEPFSHQTVHVTVMKILKGEITSILEMKKMLIEEEAKLKPLIDSYTNGQMQINKSVKRSAPKSGTVQRFALEELVGLYGNDADGEITISLDPEDEENLKIIYGKLGVGNLTPYGEPNIFYFELTSPLAIEYGKEVGKVDFSTVDQLHFLPYYGYDSIFYKNATLDTFPAIPWAPDSCGPSD